MIVLAGAQIRVHVGAAGLRKEDRRMRGVCTRGVVDVTHTAQFS